MKGRVGRAAKGAVVREGWGRQDQEGGGGKEHQKVSSAAKEKSDFFKRFTICSNLIYLHVFRYKT